ncbi:MAG TPA: hypothetical protein VL147_04560 [Devosia sp.]|nr:hypothetical protein [Devosia sp.]
MIQPVTRRNALLAIGGSLAATTVLSAPALGRRTAGHAAGDPLLLLDPDLARRDQKTVQALFGGGKSLTIERELVRQWRDGLGKAVQDARRATALVLWDKVEVLRGLGREERMKVDVTRLGQAAFRIELSV